MANHLLHRLRIVVVSINDIVFVFILEIIILKKVSHFFWLDILTGSSRKAVSIPPNFLSVKELTV